MQLFFFFLNRSGVSSQRSCASSFVPVTMLHGRRPELTELILCVVSSFLCRYMKRLRLSLHKNTEHWGISSHFVAQI